MLTKQDLIDLLNAMESIPNDAPVLIELETGIMPVSRVEMSSFVPSIRYGIYWVFPHKQGEEVYPPYKLAIQLHLGSKI